MKKPLFLCFVFSLVFTHHASLQSAIDNNNYRAACYSFEVNFSKIKQAFPEFQSGLPETMISYVYYVQYGRDTLIEFFDIGYNSLIKNQIMDISSYADCTFSETVYFNRTREYARTINTIDFLIDDSKGIVKSLCDPIGLNQKCDSLIYISTSTNTEYKVFIDYSVSNLRSQKLLYPDIQYLPYKIIRLGKDSTVFNLEELIFGKPAIDSLLQMEKLKNYRLFDPSFIHPDDLKMITDFVEKLDCIEDK
jgi:hypothetical protein